MKKTEPFDLDKLYKNSEYIIGMDESAWGCIADIFTVAICAFHRSQEIPSFIRDSKKMNEKQRLKAYDWIMENALFHFCVRVEPSEFINGAAKVRDQAMISVIKEADSIGRSHKPLLVIDGLYVPKQTRHTVPTVILPKADVHVPAVSAASIIAKVIHDNSINYWDTVYPEFNWKSNKGYATPDHNDALRDYGATPRHRFNIKKVKESKLYSNP